MAAAPGPAVPLHAASPQVLAPPIAQEAASTVPAPAPAVPLPAVANSALAIHAEQVRPVPSEVPTVPALPKAASIEASLPPSVPPAATSPAGSHPETASHVTGAMAQSPAVDSAPPASESITPAVPCENSNELRMLLNTAVAVVQPASAEIKAALKEARQWEVLLDLCPAVAQFLALPKACTEDVPISEASRQEISTLLEVMTNTPQYEAFEPVRRLQAFLQQHPAPPPPQTESMQPDDEFFISTFLVRVKDLQAAVQNGIQLSTTAALEGDDFAALMKLDSAMATWAAFSIPEADELLKRLKEKPDVVIEWMHELVVQLADSPTGKIADTAEVVAWIEQRESPQAKKRRVE